MKKLPCTLFLLGSISAFANDHIDYSRFAQQIAGNDACASVAAESLVNYLAGKMPDPSDLDMLNVEAIYVIRRGETYVFKASINGGIASQEYTIDVKCSGRVR